MYFPGGFLYPPSLVVAFLVVVAVEEEAREEEEVRVAREERGCKICLSQTVHQLSIKSSESSNMLREGEREREKGRKPEGRETRRRVFRCWRFGVNSVASRKLSFVSFGGSFFPFLRSESFFLVFSFSFSRETSIQENLLQTSAFHSIRFSPLSPRTFFSQERRRRPSPVLAANSVSLPPPSPQVSQLPRSGPSRGLQ